MHLLVIFVSFCADQCHRYLRTDDFQRRVRAHDKSFERDDPSLRDTFSQRTEMAIGVEYDESIPEARTVHFDLVIGRGTRGVSIRGVHAVFSHRISVYHDSRDQAFNKTNNFR